MTQAEAAEMMGEQVFAPGMHGFRFDEPEGIYIPVITADSPGHGDVGIAADVDGYRAWVAYEQGQGSGADA